MKARTLWPQWALAGAFVFSSARAQSQDPPRTYPSCDRTPTEGEVAAAKGAFQAGNASFNEADYNRAIDYWEDAYRRDCTAHLLLLNLARAYELNEQREHAIVALETYLERNPSSPDEAQIRRRIDKLQAQIEEERARRAALTPAAEETKAAPPPPPPVDEEPIEEEPPATGHRSFVPLIVVGVGGVVAITGSILYASAASDLREFDETCPNRRCPGTDEEADRLVEEGNSARNRQTTGALVTAGGAVAIAGGLLWYFLQDSGGGEDVSRPMVQPEGGFGYAGARFSTTF